MRIRPTTFNWDTGESTFFKFSSGTWLAESSTPDGWDADLDSSDNITVFDSAIGIAHPTSFVLSGTTPLKAKIVFDDVSGSVDFGAQDAHFTITAHVAFSASGLVSEGSCKTSTFTISFAGHYWAGDDSSTFTVPTLSGSGSQACGGFASTINSDLSLGGSAALLHFNKFVISI